MPDNLERITTFLTRPALGWQKDCAVRQMEGILWKGRTALCVISDEDDTICGISAVVNSWSENGPSCKVLMFQPDLKMPENGQVYHELLDLVVDYARGLGAQEARFIEIPNDNLLDDFIGTGATLWHWPIDDADLSSLPGQLKGVSGLIHRPMQEGDINAVAEVLVAHAANAGVVWKPELAVARVRSLFMGENELCRVAIDEGTIVAALLTNLESYHNFAELRQTLACVHPGADPPALTLLIHEVGLQAFSMNVEVMTAVMHLDQVPALMENMFIEHDAGFAEHVMLLTH